MHRQVVNADGANAVTEGYETAMVKREDVRKYDKYDDLYGLLDDVEAEIGWAATVDGLAAMIGKSAEYRNGEGPDPLDDGDTHWEFAIICQNDKEKQL